MTPWDADPVAPARPPQPAQRSTPAATALGGTTERRPAAPPRAPQAAAQAGAAAAPAAAPWDADPLAPPEPVAAAPREVGFVEGAGRIAASSLAPVARAQGMLAASTLEIVKEVAGLADEVAPLFGLQSTMRQRVQDFQDRTIAIADARAKAIQQSYAPKPGEEFGLGAQIVGGLASMPAEVMGGGGVQHGLSRAAEVIERGGTIPQAAQAGVTSGAANVTANLLPAKLGGVAGAALERGLARVLPGGARTGAVAGGAASGGALGAGADLGVAAAENAALPEGEAFTDLQREAEPGVAGGLGAAIGGVAAGAATRGKAARVPKGIKPAQVDPGNKQDVKMRPVSGFYTPEAITKFANERLAELEGKGEDAPDQTMTMPDGKKVTVKGRLKEFVSPEDRAEIDFLRKAAGNVEKIADGYGIGIEPSAGVKPPKGSTVGAQQVDVETQRRERAASLPVPIELTKGQATRDFEQQQFEKETAKDGKTGAPLREQFADQNAKVKANLDALYDLTGAEMPDVRGAGKRVVDALAARAAEVKRDVDAEYAKAREAGEMAEEVDTTALVTKLRDIEPSAANAGVIKTAEAELVRLGGATRADDGSLVPGKLSLDRLEELRKTVGVGGRKDATNAHFAGEIRQAIDMSTEDAGGDIYRGARAKYRDYAEEFKSRKIVAQLIETKRGTDERKTALEDVVKRTVHDGSVEEITKLRDTLRGAGLDGQQAWREIQGQVIDEIREATFRNVSRNERGDPVASVAGMDRAIKRLDRDGKLDLVFGKKGAEILRDLRDLTSDVYTAPPGSVNFSNTAGALRNMVDQLATYGLTGLPVPAREMMLSIRRMFQARGLRKKVAEALPKKGEPVVGKPLGDRPFEPPPSPPPAPKPAAPAPSAPAVSGTAKDPRLAEIDRLREGAAPAVARVLDDRAREIADEAKMQRVRDQREAAAQQLEETASKTEDPQTRAALRQRANSLRTERIPTGEASELPPATGRAPLLRKLPVGRAREVLEPPATGRAPDLPLLPVGKVIEGEPPDAPAAAAVPRGGPPDKPLPTGEARELDDAEFDAWKREHGFGDLAAAEALKVDRALQVDAPAVEKAATQHAKQPGSFARAIDRILEKETTRATDTPGAAEGGKGLPRQGRREEGDQQGEGPDAGAQAAAAQEAERLNVAAGETEVAKAIREFEKATAPTGNPITDALGDKLRTDYSRAVQEYAENPDTKGGTVLNTDVARELSADYLADRTRSADVHEPASAFVKRLYAEKLAAPTPEGLERRVLFTAGGTGAGKTTGINAMGDAMGRPEITYDTNMNTLGSAVKKIEQALDAGREVRIAYVYADPLQAFEQAMARANSQKAKFGTGRTVPITEHAATHAGVSKVIRDLMDRYRHDLRVNFTVIDNSRGRGGAREVDLRGIPVVSDNGLREKLEAAARQAHRSGRIDDATLAGFLGEQRPAQAPQREAVGAGVRRGPEQGDERRAAAQEVAPPAPSFPGPAGSTTAVVTERGMRVPVRYRLAELGDLTTSHNDDLSVNPAFPAEFQPRDRTRAASEAKITRIANALQPELLADSPKASDGAPIVGPGGTVESGNARTIALRRAYAAGKADGYRDWLAANAERFGLTADQVRSMQRPALVRERTVDVDVADFARQANEAAVSAMSDAEQAKADAGQLPDLEGLVSNDDGTINLIRSVDFVRDFMRTVASPSERGQLMTADGRLSQRGVARIRNAVFAKAYDDAELVARMAEATDGNTRNVMAGLLRAAPEVAQLRDLSAAGARGDAQFVPDLVEAVRRFSDAREAGQKVDEALSQGSLIGGEPPPRVADFMRQLEIDSRAPRRIADWVSGLVQRVDSAGDPRQGSLLGAPERIADDLEAQQRFLEQRAKAAGHKDIDAWAAADIDGFLRAATDWRERNPKTELLGAAGATAAAALAASNEEDQES